MRNATTQTGPAPAQRSKHTQTEPHLCLHCHTAQLAELLQPGRAGRPAAGQGDFADACLSSIEEEEENDTEDAGTDAGPADQTRAQVLATSLRGTDGRPLRHVLLDPDLLRLVLGVGRQSLGGRTAE